MRTILVAIAGSAAGISLWLFSSPFLLPDATLPAGFLNFDGTLSAINIDDHTVEAVLASDHDPRGVPIIFSFDERTRWTLFSYTNAFGARIERTHTDIPLTSIRRNMPATFIIYEGKTEPLLRWVIVTDI